MVLYDDRETGGAVGRYALYTEITEALGGYDAFHSRYEDGAFRSRAASPVVYRGQIIGAVYAYEYDTEQAELLGGLQQNLRNISLVTGLAVLLISLVLSKLLTARFGSCFQPSALCAGRLQSPYRRGRARRDRCSGTGV